MNGTELHDWAARLFPICRSITGPGVRKTLGILQECIPLEIKEVSSGTEVLDWTIPEEWTPREAWIADVSGRKIIDFKNHNLHLLQYSQPFQGRVSRQELETHLFSLPKQPDLIPYKTSYYQSQWGFCLSEKQKLRLTDDEYDIHIDVSHQPGVLNYGELTIPGETEKEILISTHICHPSMANDNLSGIVVAMEAARHFLVVPSYYTLRFIFVPGTIGAIAWLAGNPDCQTRVAHGLVLTGLGAGEHFFYKKSRSENAVIDQVLASILPADRLLPFSPYGYDERQYNSPGFALPVGCLSRLLHGTYPEYHTSADNLDFIRPEVLEESALLVGQIIERLNQNRTYRNFLPFAEPQLGRRGLYATDPEENLAILWVLNQSDGKHSLLDISVRSGLPFAAIHQAAERLLAEEILAPTVKF